jgi:hypothetical protein
VRAPRTDAPHVVSTGSLAPPRAEPNRVSIPANPAADVAAPRARDPLAAALLPVVLHRMNNVSQGLMLAQSLFAGPTERAPDPSRLLASHGAEIDELGWLVAVIASAAGADLVLERREPRGLELLARSVREALRREGRDFDPHVLASVPKLDPSIGGGWELAWSLVAWIHAAARSHARPNERHERVVLHVTFDVDAERGVATLACELGPDVAELHARAALVRARFDRAAAEVDERSARLSFPSAWLVQETAR